MKLIPVASTNIKAVGYDPQAQKMHVQFASGHVYEHGGVSVLQHAQFIASESKGKHYAETFRNKFHVKRLDDGKDQFSEAKKING